MLKGFEDIQNYIFDFDGTLINSSVEVLSCLKRACSAFDATINELKFTPDVIGPPLAGIIEAILVDNKNEKLIKNISDEFFRIYDTSETDASPMYANTYEWLISLKNSDKKIFMATNKPTVSTERLIKKYKLDMFEDIYTIDKYGERNITKKEMIEEIVEKYNLEKSETIMIGDAPSDIKAGKSAGVKTVGVLWGYGNHREFLVEASDFVLELDDLKSILQTL